MDGGPALYQACCRLYNVKPDKNILSLVQRADILNVKRIDASGTYLGRKGTLAVLEFVHNDRCVEELVLCQNDLDSTCIEKLCAIIEEGHPSLRVLDISHNTLSTASVRQLWAALGSENSVLVELRRKNCYIEEEWEVRIEQTLKRRREFLTQGFFPHGVPRGITAWQTIFILLLGGEDLVSTYCERILYPLGSYIASMRLRVAPLTVTEKDTKEAALSKLKRCREPNNYQLPWCVGFVSAPLKKMEKYILNLIFREKKVTPPPLRTKLGALRDPIYRCGEYLFLYYVVTLEERMKRNSTTVPFSQWSSECSLVLEEGISASELNSPPYSAVLLTASSFSVRCQSDLLASFSIVFREGEREEGEETSTEKRHVDSITEEEAELGFFHPNKRAIVLNYVRNTTSEVGLPLVLYGGAGIGKEKIILHVAREVRAEHRVQLVQVSSRDASFTLFLFRLLEIFEPSKKSTATCLQCLIVEVREAISRYDGPPFVVLVSHLEKLDLCGADWAAAVEWLPSTFSKKIKLVVSLNTDCPALPLLRHRSPQPYETQVAPMSDINRVNLFHRWLEQRNIALPGMPKEPVKSRDQFNALDSAFLEKEDADSLLYIHLISIFVQVRGLKESLSNEYEALDFLTAAPGNGAQLVESLCRDAEQYGSSITVQYVLLALSTVPFAIPDLQYICEELSPCPRHSTLPALIYLADIGLIEWSLDATAYVSHATVRRTVRALYADLVDTVSVLVENHLYRLVTTRSLEVIHAFKYLTALMIENGNIPASVMLLKNTSVLDYILKSDEEAKLLLIDSIYRLLMARGVVLELMTPGCTFQLHYAGMVQLLNVLGEIQHHTFNLFQSSLLHRHSSPLSEFARQHLDQPPYPVLCPTNTGSEDSSGHTFESLLSFSFCHCRGDYLVASTDVEVSVFDIVSGREKAHLSMPFEKGIFISSSFLASGTRVVVVSASRLLIWDFEINSQLLLDDVTTHSSASDFDSFGSRLLTRHVIQDEFFVFDIAKKVVVKELPFKKECKSACFCGSMVLMATSYTLHLLDEDTYEVSTSMEHDGAVGALECNFDGRLIASAVANVLWLWSTAGALLHSVQTGVSDILSLKFDSASTIVLVHRVEGVQLRDTLTGLVLGDIKNPLNYMIPSSFCFSEDGVFLMGLEGRHILVYNTKTCANVGAFVAPFGSFTALCESDSVLFAPHSGGGVKRYDLRDPVPTVEAALSGHPSTNLLRTSKVSSSSPISSLQCNASGTLVAAIDKDGALFLYSTVTGQLVAHPLKRVRGAMFCDVDTLAAKCHEDDFLSLYNVSNGTVKRLPLPDGSDTGDDFLLFRGSEEGEIGVICPRSGRSCILLYPSGATGPRQQFMNAESKFRFACMFGSFLLAVTSEDEFILWTISKVAERSSVKYPHSIQSITSSLNGVLWFIDDAQTLVQAHIESVALPGRAKLVMRTLTTLRTRPNSGRVVHMEQCNSLFLLQYSDGSLSLWKEGEKYGSIAVPSATFTCMSITDVNSTLTVFLGNGSGEVVLSGLYFPP